jgi:hypothetical protein
MKTSSLRLLALAALLLAPVAPLYASEAPKPAKPMLFAAYYVWYHTGDHPRQPWLHWTYPAAEANALAQKARLSGEPAIASAARPLAGFYDSADPAVAEWHVQLAKAAGIDAFLVSWWDTVNGLDKSFESGILAAAVKQGFKIALLDERAQFHNKLEDYQAMLTRALRKYKDSPAYLRLDGRPVVYLYQVAAKPGLTPEDFAALRKHVEGEVGPVYWIVDKIVHDAGAQRAGDEDRVKCIPKEWLATPGIDSFAFYSTFSNFRAYRYEELTNKYRYMVKLAHDAGRKMLLPVHPGHDNSHFRDDPYVMPRRDGQTLRDYLRAATDAGADFIMVTSWNEWPETTVVEPSSTWPDPYLYLKILAEWKGIAFTAPPLPENRK